jgi:HK97 gp10 family phage protein
MMTFKIEGGQAMARQLDRLEASISRRVQIAALKEAAVPMRDRMEELAPRGNPADPNLYEEIAVSAAKGEDEREAAVAVGPTRGAFYGSFQELADEYGGVHHPAQPFARPAFDLEARNSLDILVDELWWSLKHGVVGPEKFVG